MKKQRIHYKDLIGGIFFFIFGLFLGFESLQLQVWVESQPSEGFFPLAIASIIAVLSLVSIIKELVSSVFRGKEDFLGKQEEKAVSNFRAVSYTMTLLIYVALMEGVGFLISSSICITFILKYLEGRGWKIAIFAGVTSTIMSYLLFVHFLKVPLPKGFLKWL